MSMYLSNRDVATEIGAEPGEFIEPSPQCDAVAATAERDAAATEAHCRVGGDSQIGPNEPRTAGH